MNFKLTNLCHIFQIIFSNMGERNDSDLEDEKKDDIEYKTKTKEEYICQLRKCSDDTELKKPQIRFQNESEDEAGVRSDSEISVVKTRPLSGIFKFFKSNKGVHHGNHSSPYKLFQSWAVRAMPLF